MFCEFLEIGFMASTLFDEEKSAMMMAMALIFPNFLLAGLIWPIDSKFSKNASYYKLSQLPFS